ncbi:MAG: histidinol-phosphate transaminase [Eubacteriales bacterium]
MHGGDIYTFQRATGKTPLDFSENTNPYGLPVGVKNAMLENIDYLNRYPDPNCRALTEVVAHYLGISEDYLLFGNGAADIIYRIAYALKPKKALILAPTFSEYEASLRSVGTEVSYFLLEERNQFTLTEEIIEAIPENNIIYICNPNNPTGKMCEYALMKKIMEACEKHRTYLVVDECFMDFVEKNFEYSLLQEVKTFQHLIILKAFTKVFAMAGIRLGYCITSNKSVLENIKQSGQPWTVSSIAQIAGIACCQENIYLEESLAEIKKERVYMIESLQNLGVRVYESDVNYVLFRYHAHLAESLMKYGIMIRVCNDYNGLDDSYYRVAIKLHHENKKLIMALQEIRQEEPHEVIT